MNEFRQKEGTCRNYAVQCHGVTRGYGAGDARVLALRGVDLDVLRGELLMLMGPSGCGKTTLLSIFAGLLDRDSGTCVVLDHDLQRLPPDARARFRGASIGFVFQSFNLLPALTATENVAVPLLINGMPREHALVRARETLAATGLGDRLESLPAQLSGGQQQRIAIARALVHEPQLIICDEPTSNLDHETGRAMMELLGRVGRTAARTLIVVTHDTRILEFADRVARMEDGRIVDIAPGAPVELHT
jgi:putative ABC transport system ATP-binding protein